VTRREEPEQSLPESQLSYGVYLVPQQRSTPHRYRPCLAGHSGRCLTVLPKQPVLFSEDASLLGDLSFPLGQRLRFRRQVALAARDGFALTGQCFPCGGELRCLDGGVTRCR